MSITAIIVTHNSAGIVASALRCVYGHPKITRCIVVDNASTDATIPLISVQFPNVHIISNHRNTGFGAACNQALEQVSTPFALLLNPDAVIDGEGVDRLLECFATHSNAAIVAPRLVGNSFDESTWGLRLPAIHSNNLPKAIPTDDKNVLKVSFISGAIAMWRIQHMQKVGYFDPAFFLFYEDDDISLRVTRSGYEMLLISGINAQHSPGKSCVVTEALEALKIRSSTWSYLYIHHKYRGAIIAKILALRLIIKSMYALRWNGRAALKIEKGMNKTSLAEKPLQASQKQRECAHKRWAAAYYLRNPRQFTMRAND